MTVADHVLARLTAEWGLSSADRGIGEAKDIALLILRVGSASWHVAIDGCALSPLHFIFRFYFTGYKWKRLLYCHVTLTTPALDY